MNTPTWLKLSLLEAIFLIAVLLGPAAAYSKLYLFHLVLLVLLAKSVPEVTLWRGKLPPRALWWDNGFFLFFLAWYVLSILWAEDRVYALQYCTYVGLGVLTVYFTVKICRTSERLRGAIWVILGTVSIEIFLAILEGMKLIRLPFSPYSPYRWLFGRQPNSFDGLAQSQINYLQGVPTGFAGNPNNLAAFLVLALPMFLFARRWWVAVLGVAAIYFVIDLAGARAGAIAFWVVMAVGIALFAAYRMRVGAIAILLAAAIFASDMGGDSKLADYSQAASRLGEGLLSGQATDGDSVGIRTQLILNGLSALRETFGLGVGAGGSLSVQIQAGDDRIGGIVSMHNFWVELLVDGGVLFAVLFFSWAGWLMWRLWQIGRWSSQVTLRYLGQALSLGFVGFFFSAMGPSSVIYLLPMWMFIGLSLAVIKLNAKEHSLHASHEPLATMEKTAS